ncbi:methyl-accepting chemotaxis protein [Candidatus Methylospira mobilis]|nr:methyl-accepting chemotaxis protein [Candidatus Methylospira mobilis]WNV04450.1 methyl-accepting chemotaxis protein [Candidatus Methylospira mobilis]
MSSSTKSSATTFAGLFIVLAFVLGASGLYGITATSKGLDTLYQNRSAPLQRLQEIKQLLLQNRISVQDPISLTSLEILTNGANVTFRLDPSVVAFNAQEIEKNLGEITRLKDAFASSELSDSEKAFAATFNEDHAAFVRDAIRPALTALQNGAPEEVKRIILTRVRPLYEVLRQDIDRLIDQELTFAKTGYAATQAQASRAITLICAVLVITIAAIILFALRWSRRVSRPLAQFETLLREMAGGNFDSDALISRPDGQFATIFDSLIRLRQRMRESSGSGSENAGLALMALKTLDRVNSYVMIADRDNKIQFVNKSFITWFTPHEAEIRKDVPAFNVSRLVGSNADIFHKGPERVRQMLASINDPVKSAIEVGGRKFKLTVSPLFTDKGERLGACVEWIDNTEHAQFEHVMQDGFERVVHAATQGDFTQRVVDLKIYGPVMKKLGDGVNELLATTEAWLHEFAVSLHALAEGDLTREMADEGADVGVFSDMLRDNNETVMQLSKILRSVRLTADTIKSAASEIAAGNVDLSQRTEEQAASLEETASSMEQLASTVKQNAENARQANQLAEAASSVAIKGGEVVSEVVNTMNSIQESSRKVVDIISVIDGIAFQTNILALNAAVEAARAGEQGRGFAVVASEVRNLAQRSAAAAKEIKQLISDSVEKVENGNRQVEDAGRTMKEIVTSVRRVTDIMSEISAASAEQSSGIDQVNLAITQMDEVTQQNAALVEEAAAAAESLEEQSRELHDMLTVFKLVSPSGGDLQLAPQLHKTAYSAKQPIKTASPPAVVSAAKRSIPPRALKPSLSSSNTPAPTSGKDDDWQEF